MVLIRIALLVVLALAGCGQSLFDNRPGGDDGGPDTTPSNCDAPCIADASADFDGSMRGKNGQWRYLEDFRNHQWAAMDPDGADLAGDDDRNRIAPCDAHPDAPACVMLPGALLVSSAGPGSLADPALEFTASSAQVLQLVVRARVPSGDAQVIRLYRNGREDVLFTGTAMPGATLERTVEVDALPGDRFLVAVDHSGAAAATDVGLDLTINATAATFPSSCQLALTFEAKTGNSVRDLCRGSLFTLTNMIGGQAQLSLPNGPFFEQGTAGNIPDSTHFHDLTDKRFDRGRGLTVQFWVKLESFAQPNKAVVLSDLDVVNGGGLSIAIVPDITPRLDVSTCSSPIAPTIDDVNAPYPALGTWQFVRVVHTGSTIDVCLNGTRVSHLAVVSSGFPVMNAPEMGKNPFETRDTAHFIGQLDDVRVLGTALPCE